MLIVATVHPKHCWSYKHTCLMDLLQIIPGVFINLENILRIGGVKEETLLWGGFWYTRYGNGKTTE